MKRISLEFIRPRFTLVLLLFILLAIAFTGTAFAETVVSVSLQEPVAGGDENLTVNVYIEPDESVAGVQFDFMFDSSLASVENVREGDMLKQPGSDTMFSPGDVDNSRGILTGVHGFILGKSAATAPGIFATIDLTSTGGSGICELQLSNVIISDSSGHAVPVRVVNHKVRIENLLTLLAEEPSGETQSEEESTEEVLTGENSEDNQEDQNNQPVFLSIFSDIRNFFRDQFNIK
ncbi:cohesin domain-containing protein [Methanosarcina sp.]|uniref:cohesin domain-containing protein n=1 Tax=Methanosarcina sp. TaxID=2213 RepID=UPI002AB9EAC3|nr:cohesin domain-containing protein [Methanosarcina sp.]MDY9926308.1 cohesin domain-containing protein [Methanosarcina sp.]